MKRLDAEIYKNCYVEFEGLLNSYVSICNEMILIFGVTSAKPLLEAKKNFISGAKALDLMCVSDSVLLSCGTFKEVAVNKITQLSLEHKGKDTPLSIEEYKVIAERLRVFIHQVREFSLKVAKLHGKTKVRSLLDFDIFNFYFYLETRMYREFPLNHDEIWNIF